LPLAYRTMMSALPHDLDEDALLALLHLLQAEGYRHITITPASHARVLDHRQHETGRTLADIFGWNLPFQPEVLARPIREAMHAAGILAEENGWAQSRMRVSSIDDALFLHSAFPTGDADSVFFGPDTYRFVRFMQEALLRRPPAVAPRILDIGCGAGAGGLMLGRWCAGARLVMNDINPLALRHTAINARAMDLPVELAQGDGLSAVRGEFDLIISNPPYLVDHSERTYRHGGERLGRALSVRIASEALTRLKPGGRLLLYTGVAIENGRDGFLEEMRPLLAQAGYAWGYAEIDPDVFGEELDQPAYLHVDRIAAVGLEAMAPEQG
jgi:methylase of polypeptide subunit release factors